MTPPTLAKAREILAAAAVNAGTVGNPTSPVVAAAIDVVFARLDHVEGLLAVHERHLAAWASAPPRGAPTSTVLIGDQIPGVRSIPSREDAREMFGRRAGDAIWDAFGSAQSPVVVQIGATLPPPKAAPSDASVDRPPDAVAIPPHGSWSPGTHGRSTVLNLTDHGQAISGSCNSTTGLVTIRNEAPSGEMRVVCLNGQTARLAPGDTAVLQQRSDGQFERVVQWMPAPPTAHGTAIPRDALVADKLPCPFCGRTDLLCVEARPESRFYCIRCRACGAIGPACGIHVGDPHGDREAAAHWNRRAARPTPTLWQAIAAGTLIAQSPGETDEAFRARVLAWRREIGAERSAPARPADDTCVRCGDRRYYSARQRGDGLCGPCHREACRAGERITKGIRLAEVGDQRGWWCVVPCGPNDAAIGVALCDETDKGVVHVDVSPQKTHDGSPGVWMATPRWPGPAACVSPR